MDSPAALAHTINAFFTGNPVFTVAIGLSAVAATVVYSLSFSDVVAKEIKRRRMKQRIDRLHNHYIVCGFGRVGHQVAKELASENEAFVIIDRDEDSLKLAKEEGWLFLVGDGAVDETLFSRAHIESAKGLIIAVGSDADAIFMAISAKALKPDIFLVARASNVDVADKLTKVGVNRVALPYQIGGYHMATMALRPSVVDFLDLLVDEDRSELEMEEIIIAEGQAYDGQSLKDAHLVKPGVAILAIRHKNGKAAINPNEATVLQGGDRLVAMGSQADLEALVKKAQKEQDISPQRDKKVASIGLRDIKPAPFEKDGS